MMLCAKAYEIHNNETSVCRLFKGYEAKVVGMWQRFLLECVAVVTHINSANRIICVLLICLLFLQCKKTTTSQICIKRGTCFFLPKTIPTPLCELDFVVLCQFANLQ